MKAMDLLREAQRDANLLSYGQLIDITLVDEAFPETFLRERLFVRCFFVRTYMETRAEW